MIGYQEAAMHDRKYYENQFKPCPDVVTKKTTDGYAGHLRKYSSVTAPKGKDKTLSYRKPLSNTKGMRD